MGKHFTQHFDTIADLVLWIDSNRPVWKQRESTTTSPSPRWDLGLGYEGALKLAAEGWADGASRMSEALATLPAMESVNRSAWGVAGGSVNVGRYCSGNPACMRTRKREHGHKPAITLAVSTAANFGTRAEYMSNYGLAVARYADQLEMNGYPVQVIAVVSAKQSGTNRTAFSWTVKEQGHAMNLADMAFSIGHPACFRRLGFAFFERADMPEYSGYGYAGDIIPGDLPPQYRDAILLNGLASANGHSTTPDKALAALTETLDAILAKREAVYS